VLFRRELALGAAQVRAGAAVLALVALPLGPAVCPAAQIGAIVAVLVAALAAEPLSVARGAAEPAPRARTVT
jgi:hypothetical protein